MNADMDKIYDYWFGQIKNGTTLEKRNTLWFGAKAETDHYILAHFESLLNDAFKGYLDEWTRSPKGSMALIILLDQFPLNMYRKQAKAYSFESKALEVCNHGLSLNYHKKLSFIENIFYYLPLEHSESADHQTKSVELYTQLASEADSAHKEHAQNALNYAKSHQAIIKQFSRFPHRNNVLNRNTTPEENILLENPSNRFGQ
jgi:uncharacterized protein (DUF924 family)